MDTRIEALLFALGRPLSRHELQKMLGCSSEELEEGLAALTRRRSGLTAVDDGREIELRVAGQEAPLIERVRKEEYSREIGKAGLEVLAAVLYRGPLTRSEIDFIRGVNSSQTLRTLALRGLIRKIDRDTEGRPAQGAGRRSTYLYEPTTELLASLGVARRQDLPDYASVRERLQTLEEAYRQKEAASQDEPRG